MSLHLNDTTVFHSTVYLHYLYIYIFFKFLKNRDCRPYIRKKEVISSGTG